MAGRNAMSGRQPIATAPKDGSKVQVFWKDEDGQENESLAQYRSLDRLKATGGQWDETDAGCHAACMATGRQKRR
eukprot:gene4396-5492_t